MNKLGILTLSLLAIGSIGVVGCTQEDDNEQVAEDLLEDAMGPSYDPAQISCSNHYYDNMTCVTCYGTDYGGCYAWACTGGYSGGSCNP